MKNRMPGEKDPSRTLRHLRCLRFNLVDLFQQMLPLWLFARERFGFPYQPLSLFILPNPCKRSGLLGERHDLQIRWEIFYPNFAEVLQGSLIFGRADRVSGKILELAAQAPTEGKVGVIEDRLGILLNQTVQAGCA